MPGPGPVVPGMLPDLAGPETVVVLSGKVPDTSGTSIPAWGRLVAVTKWTDDAARRWYDVAPTR